MMWPSIHNDMYKDGGIILPILDILVATSKL